MRLSEDTKPKTVSIRPEQPHRQIERADGKQDGAAAGELEDGAGLAAFGGGQSRDARHVARPFRKLAVRRAPPAFPPSPARGPTSPTSRTRSWAFSTLTASRAARTAAAGSVIDAPLMARESALQSTISRTDRLIHAVIRLPIRPVLRAALTSVSPARAGAARPTRGIGAGGHREADAGKARGSIRPPAGRWRAACPRAPHRGYRRTRTDRRPRCLQGPTDRRARP